MMMIMECMAWHGAGDQSIVIDGCSKECLEIMITMDIILSFFESST